MDQEPLLLVGMIAAVAYFAKLWRDDYRAARDGKPNPRALPGAVPSLRPAATVLAILGGLAIVTAETLGEYQLGISGEQSEITVLFGVYMLAAAFMEELIFRGFLVLPHRGRAVLIAGIVGASLVFALAHPFLWTWKDGALHFNFGVKGWFSTAVVFVASLWFYTVRFWPLNPTRSLVPCIAAHAAKNLGVFAIKYAQGFVSGWW